MTMDCNTSSPTANRRGCLTGPCACSGKRVTISAEELRASTKPGEPAWQLQHSPGRPERRGFPPGGLPAAGAARPA